ncbi:transcription factor [Seminavis robusta]|uniref:Transcription factor n=1 Tax=Seminavis robusta TaxID=568900 RepID=A0A9N8DFX7_9STRA|nr:transcription factor [Seminavis robusta]|eukprot:Sro125_g060050.1 transcription factor (362) ;mRNA; r:4064-5330
MASDSESVFSDDRSRRASVVSIASTIGGGEENSNSGEFVITSRSRGVSANNLVIPSTYQLVEDGTQHYPHIISWTKEGDAFEIKDIDALERTILGVKFFGTNKYASFRRQLNKYQFARSHRQSIRKDVPFTRIDVFRHKFFQRGRPDLLNRITRQSSNKPKSTEEAKALKTRLEELEDVQSELRRTMARLDASNIEQSTLIRVLKKHDATKDTVIQGLEARLGALEDRLARSSAPQYSKRTTNDLFGPTRSPSIPGFGPIMPAVRSESNDFFDLARSTSIPGLGVMPWRIGHADSPNLAIPMETSANPPATLPPHPKKKRGGWPASLLKDTEMALCDPVFRLDSMTWLNGKYHAPHDDGRL